tara:strand:+ start:2292 stop:2450 length:159 start_codon:yes stop_codon:yes gene_type:complete
MPIMNIYIPDFIIQTIAIIAMLLVIVKLKKLENERMSVMKNAEKNLEGDKYV